MHFVVNYNDGRMVVLFRGEMMPAMNYYNRNTGCSIKLIMKGLKKYKYFEHKCLWILDPNDIDPFRYVYFDRIGEICEFIKIENRNITINSIMH